MRMLIKKKFNDPEEVIKDDIYCDINFMKSFFVFLLFN